MENYKKAVIRELETYLPLPTFIQQHQQKNENSPAVTISVKTGTKMRNVLSFGFKQLERPDIKHVVWLAEAEAIGKAVSCAEIMKRGQLGPNEDEPPAHSANKRKSVSANNSIVEPPSSASAKTSCSIPLHQTNVLGYRRTEEIWEPVVQGLDKLKVNKDVPILAIILSKEPQSLNDFPSNAAPVIAFQHSNSASEGFESFWQNRVNACLSQVPVSSGSAAIEIKKPQQSGGSGQSSGRTPPFMSASPLS